MLIFIALVFFWIYVFISRKIKIYLSELKYISINQLKENPSINNLDDDFFRQQLFFKHTKEVHSIMEKLIVDFSYSPRNYIKLFFTIKIYFFTVLLFVRHEIGSLVTVFLFWTVLLIWNQEEFNNKIRFDLEFYENINLMLTIFFVIYFFSFMLRTQKEIDYSNEAKRIVSSWYLGYEHIILKYLAKDKIDLIYLKIFLFISLTFSIVYIF